MTDKDIIKALELCIEGGDGSCTICPYANTPNCYAESGKDILDLINRYQAEDDKLRKRLKKQKHTLFEQQAYSAELQAEIARLKKSNRNWRRKVQRLRAEKKIAEKQIYEKGLL